VTKLAALHGLDNWQRRLTHAAPKGLQSELLSEAAAIAEQARQRAREAIAAEVEIFDESRGETVRYAVGTRQQAGRHVEYGTTKHRAQPWLMPAFYTRLPYVKDRITKMLAASFRRSGRRFDGSARRG